MAPAGPMGFVAAGLALYTLTVHAFAGHRRVVAPLLASSLDPFSKATLDVVWHMVTWTLLVLAGGLLLGAETVRIGAGLLAGGYAIIFVVVAQRTFGAAIRLPQWILLGALGLYALIPRLAAPLLLGGIAVLHVAWALGSRWPGRDDESLALAVIGRRGTPSPGACLVVALAMAAMLFALLGGPPPWLRATIAAIFIARGTLGFVERWLRREIRGTPYEIYSAFMYTPLSLSIGLAILVQP